MNAMAQRAAQDAKIPEGQWEEKGQSNPRLGTMCQRWEGVKASAQEVGSWR